MQSVNLIIDPPNESGWNMAVDEALLQLANETGQGTLRFYQWSRPTLSLGYFQKSDDRKLHPASALCAMVRRASGGGAIVHDQELTYSLSLAGTNRWSSSQNDLYGSVHQTIVRFLHTKGVLASQFEFPVKEGQKDLEPGETADYPDPDSKRFLCFERRTAGDIVLDNFKIGGSAQRRYRNATLQHGSLLLNRSEHAPELPGVLNLAAVPLSADEIVTDLADLLAEDLNLRLVRESLSEKQKINAEQIRSEKYDHADWTFKR